MENYTKFINILMKPSLTFFVNPSLKVLSSKMGWKLVPYPGVITKSISISESNVMIFEENKMLTLVSEDQYLSVS